MDFEDHALNALREACCHPFVTLKVTSNRGRAAYSRKMRKSSRKRRIIVESESSEAEIEESQRLPVESDDET